MTVKIVVVGDFNVDLVIYLDRLPKVGETLNGNDFIIGPGGKGSNQAVATARLGADVSFVGRIGADDFANIALDVWKAEGMNLSHLGQDDEVGTAVALISVDNAGNNTIAVAQQANLRLTTDHLNAAEDLIAGADVLMTQLGLRFGVVERALEIARTHDTTTVLNPAPAAQISKEMLALADYITPNEGELEIIAGQSGDIVEAARSLIVRDDQTVIVTLGEQGAQWVTARETKQVPAYPVDVIDTVGAGDGFNAGLAVALAEGRALEDAIAFAHATAAVVVQRQGAAAAMPKRNEVEAFLHSRG